jgi:hypothetical protein
VSWPENAGHVETASHFRSAAFVALIDATFMASLQQAPRLQALQPVAPSKAE